MERKNVRALALIVILACLIQAASVHDVQAATYSSQVTQVNRVGGLAGIPARNLQNPKEALTIWQFSRILKNLYGGRINLPASFISGEALTQQAACIMLTEVSRQLGVKMRWKGGSAKARVNLDSACRLIVSMVEIGGSLRPERWG